jgi:iron complex outermembrane receptor protein
VLVTGDYSNENDANYASTFGGNYNQNLSAAQLAAQVSPTTLTINGVPTKIFGNTPTGVLVGYSVAPGKNDISEDSQPIYRNEAYGLNVTANYDLTDALTLRSITSYRNNNHFQVVPVAYTQGFIDTNGVWERVGTVSQEVQLVGDLWRQHFVVGAYYFRDANYNLVEVSEGYPEKLGGISVPPGQYYEFQLYGANLTTESMAAYVHDEIQLTDEWSLTLGGRFTRDGINEADIAANPPVQQGLIPAAPFPYPIPAYAYLAPRSVRYDNFSPRVTLTYRPSDDTMMYATWSKGFKSGGFNPGADQPPLAPTVEPAFQPEKITDYEVGVKKDWLDHRVRTNVAGYYYDYSNLQVQQKNINAVILINNAASATIYGLEASAQAVVTDNLVVNLGTSLIHAEYNSFCNADSNRSLLPTSPVCAAQGYPAGTQDLSGNTLNRAPQYVVNAGADYTWPAFTGLMDAHFDATFSGLEYFSPFNVSTLTSPAHELLNASLRYDSSKGIFVEGWLKNITDKQVPGAISSTGLSAGANVNLRLTPPRTVGVSVGYKF